MNTRTHEDPGMENINSKQTVETRSTLGRESIAQMLVDRVSNKWRSSRTESNGNVEERSVNNLGLDQKVIKSIKQFYHE